MQNSVSSTSNIDCLFFTLLQIISDEIRRGLLTINDKEGNYNYYEYWWSYSHALSANKRCLIASFDELEYFVYNSYDPTYKDYLKKYMLKLIKKTPEQIIEDFESTQKMENWKMRLIKEPELLRIHCKSKYIAIPNDNSCCYLLKGKRPRSIDVCKKVE